MESVPPTQCATTQPDTARRRVLIADDNSDAAESLALLLAFHGYAVCVATDGLQAIDAIATFKPDAVVLDLSMPKLNGFDVAHELRRRAELSHLSLIAVTGWGRMSDRQRAFDAGFDAYLTKPTDLVALLTELSRER